MRQIEIIIPDTPSIRDNVTRGRGKLSHLIWGDSPHIPMDVFAGRRVRRGSRSGELYLPIDDANFRTPMCIMQFRLWSIFAQHPGVRMHFQGWVLSDLPALRLTLGCAHHRRDPESV